MPPELIDGAGKRGAWFQGRYKSLLVETRAHLGTLRHNIHLNPVRAVS